VTQGVVAQERPAEQICALAARYFGVRFVCAFGPQAPDGVIDLDRVILAGESAPAALSPGGSYSDRGLVTFSLRSGEPQPIYRPASSLLASAASLLASAPATPADRVLTLLDPASHAGLSTGLAAALTSGATLEAHPLFDAAVLADAIASHGAPTHLVAPGWLEPALAESGLAERLASVTLVHRAPIRFKAKTFLKRNIVDVLAFDELALLAKRRSAAGEFALSLDETSADGGLASNLLRVKLNSEGFVAFSGPAADARPFGRYGSASLHRKSGWISSGFKAEVFAGILIGAS
jgi:hypothetical protein